MKPQIMCDRQDNFMPLQCEPVEDNTRMTKKGGPMDCRCVDVITGVTIEGSEVRVERGRKQPDCRPRGTYMVACVYQKHKILIDLDYIELYTWSLIIFAGA